DAYLINIASGAVTLVVLAIFLKVWKPRTIWRFKEEEGFEAPRVQHSVAQVFRGWLPFLILGVFVMAWGWPSVKSGLDKFEFAGIKGTYSLPVPMLDKVTVRTPPVVTKETPQSAVYTFNWLSTTGTGVFIAGILASLVAGLSPKRFYQTFLKT